MKFIFTALALALLGITTVMALASVDIDVSIKHRLQNIGEESANLAAKVAGLDATRGLDVDVGGILGSWRTISVEYTSLATTLSNANAQPVSETTVVSIVQTLTSSVKVQTNLLETLIGTRDLFARAGVTQQLADVFGRLQTVINTMDAALTLLALTPIQASAVEVQFATVNATLSRAIAIYSPTA